MSTVSDSRKTEPIDAKILSNSIENAQKHLEGENFNRRKNVLEYDDVMNQQRTIIYNQRKEVLDGKDLKDKIEHMISSTVSDSVNAFLSGDDKSMWDIESLKQKYLGLICTEEDFELNDESADAQRKETKKRFLTVQ